MLSNTLVVTSESNVLQ